MPRQTRSNPSRQSRVARVKRKIANESTEEEQEIVRKERRLGMARRSASHSQEQREAAHATSLRDQQLGNLRSTRRNSSYTDLNQAAFQYDCSTDQCLHTSVHIGPLDIVKERTMAEDSSNDASIVAITSDEDDDKPIKKLFKRLMNNDCKQHTILTNNQILNLLKVEFDINVYKLHNIEIDIFITLLKKYLKDWPLWEEFDIMVNEAKKANNLPSLDGMLQSKYKHLKAYLHDAIEIAEPLAKEAVLKLKSSHKGKSETKEPAPPVVMEIDANRCQLNSLFLRNPTLQMVFNVNRQKSTIVIPGTRKIESILNWWNINIEISHKHANLTRLIYRREICHELRHQLINKALPCNNKVEKILLNQELYVKNSKKSKLIERNVLFNMMNLIGENQSDRGIESEMLRFIKKDIQLLPEKLYCDASYKRYMNGCAYIRYLYKDQEDAASDPKMNLQLEEKLFPMYKVSIGDFVKRPVKLYNISTVVECGMCKVTFSSDNLITELREHFEEHCAEPDWVCTNCNMTFSMLELASQWWGHNCRTEEKCR